MTPYTMTPCPRSLTRRRTRCPPGSRLEPGHAGPQIERINVRFKGGFGYVDAVVAGEVWRLCRLKWATPTRGDSRSTGPATRTTSRPGCHLATRPGLCRGRPRRLRPLPQRTRPPGCNESPTYPRRRPLALAPRDLVSGVPKLLLTGPAARLVPSGGRRHARNGYHDWMGVGGCSPRSTASAFAAARVAIAVRVSMVAEPRCGSSATLSSSSSPGSTNGSRS